MCCSGRHDRRGARDLALHAARALRRAAAGGRVRAQVGGSLVIVDNGKVIEQRGWGIALESPRLNTHEAVTEATRFQAASLSKTVNALVVLSMVRDGLLSLDDPVNAHLRTWKLPGDAERVTLHRLLSHTGGISVHGFQGYCYKDPRPTLVETLEGTEPANNKPIRIATKIGAYSYSGGGSTILQQLLIDRTDKPYAELATERVLKPLGMTASHFDQPPRDAGHHVEGYDEDGEVGGYRVYPELAAAGLWTTPSDFARVLWAIADSVKGSPGALLPKALAREMVTPVAEDSALGIYVDGRGRYHHTGTNHGFKSWYRISPGTGRGVVIMTNGENCGLVCKALRKKCAMLYGV
ncbi:MAG TPA: serine hydrolase [Gammaproteobacteria bacterium]|nr:serine hydrolase [Gammaproteobacteria bacterium]